MRLKEKNLLQKFAATLKKFSAQGAKKVEYGISKMFVVVENDLLEAIEFLCVKVNGYTFRGSNSSILNVCLLSQLGSTLNGVSE